jgi:hypothetical protein
MRAQALVECGELFKKKLFFFFYDIFLVAKIMRETAKDSLLKYEQRRAKRENMKAPQ